MEQGLQWSPPSLVVTGAFGASAHSSIVTCRVHQANKLAAKHDRVDLSRGAEVSQCDICQDRPAVLFCSEDRALICRRWGALLV